MTRKNSFQPSYVFLIVVILVVFPARTVAWGTKGHQVIARIAMSKLSPSARQAIEELLERGETLESVANWADQIKSQRPETRSWHFVPIPLTDKRYSQLKHCNKSEICIIEAIDRQITIIEDSDNNDRETRAEALKFLVHLIGDIHQPFHVTTNTNPPDNLGGNVTVSPLSGRPTNLREVWGTHLVEYGLSQSGMSVVGYASMLNKKFPRVSANQSKQASSISTQGSVTDWALEAHGLAWDAYYFNDEFMVADQKRSWALNLAYYEKNVPVVEKQLVRAGARLAKILNEIFSVKSPY